MGNVVQCCHTLSKYFKYEDAAAQPEAERSPLLSSEGSECDSPTPPDDFEDDILTVTTDVTNPLLEPEHFLFPDIILSSNLGGDITLVEPMVCLLVSEEVGGGEGVRMDEERSARGGNMAYSEVETQTEAGTQMSQAEVQTQTEVFVCSSGKGGREEASQMDVWEQIGTDTCQTHSDDHILSKAPPETQKQVTDTDVLAESGVPGEKMDRDSSTTRDVGHASFTRCTSQPEQNTEERDSDEELKTIQEMQNSAVEESSSLSHTEQNTLETQERNGDSQMLCEHDLNNTDENAAASESLKRKCTITNTEIPTRGWWTEQSLKTHINHSAGRENQTTDSVNMIPPKKNIHLEKMKEDGGSEEGAQMAPFLVDTLFPAAPHVKASPRQTEENEDEEQSDKSIRDIVDLQEMDFTVRVQAPGADCLELQVLGQMLVAELRQVLMDHEQTCHRTCFSLQRGGAVLDSLVELRSVEGIQNGEQIKVVEDCYSLLDARLHLRHVHDLLRSLDPTDAYNGENGTSPSCLTFYFQEDSENRSRREASEKDSVECSPPHFILPGCKDRPLTPLQPVRADRKPLLCLRLLTTSSWNPPPGNRKMHGDLMYLNVLTMEDRELNITSSTRGFYLNQSTAFSFNPKPAAPKILCHSLVELLSQLSPAFRKNFSALQKRRVQQHPLERLPAPFPVFTWIAPSGDHSLDCVRAQDTHTTRIGQDEHTAGQSRDWNEELQGCSELPRKSVQERLDRDRSIFKTNREFVGAAGRGAVAVIDGNAMPLNPGEAPHMQMFIWNNLFFSLGFDISEHYKPHGGNAAAHAAATCDLKGVQAYRCVDTEGLHTLGTAVVDYRGIRVIAQTIVPGILEKSQEQSVVYGSNDCGTTVLAHPRFVELLDKTLKPLRIQRHQVLDHNNSAVELCSSIETKGIMETKVRVEDVPVENHQLGYPRQHPHGLACLRPELIDAFVQHKYEVYIKIVSQGLRQLEESQQADDDFAAMTQDQIEEADEPARAAEIAGSDMELTRRHIVMRACKAVGSVNDLCFDVRFIPDVCTPGVRFPSACAEEISRQRQLLWDAAAFLLTHQIPAVLRDCLDHTTVLMDGRTLTSVLHRRGVNVRYLGALLRELDRAEEGGRLSHLQRISISEIITRSAKHIFRTYLQDVEPASFSAAVSHFLNCLLSSSCFPEYCSHELPSRRRSRRRRSQGTRVSLLTGSVWARLTPGELWGRIKAEAEDYYHYSLNSESMDEFLEEHNLQRISLLRELALKTGIQVQMRDYVFEPRHRPVFGEEDIVNMFPVVKYVKPTVTDATQLVQRAQASVQQGLLKKGYELIGQALTLFSSACGFLHEDVCTCLRLLGRLSYILGEHVDALSHQEKVVISSERLQGIDHPQTIHDYTFLALYCFAAGKRSTCLQLLYRARYLTLLVIGEDHPQVALLDSMLGLVLHGLMEYELSLKFLQNALILTSKYHGATSLKQAHSHHLLATVYESKGELRLAMQHEKEAYSIYKHQAGENNVSTMESSKYLRSLTQQAVILQKAIRHKYSNTPSASVPPPRLPTPSFGTTLQQLNLTCGIVLLPLSAKEIADLRTALRGEQKVQVDELESLLSKSTKP